MAGRIRDGLVLSAGLGTRLRPLTYVRAKPAIPLAGEPMVRRIVRDLASDGIDRLVVNLHHLPHTIAHVLGDGSDLGVRVRYSWEGRLLLGSAGGPRHALTLLEADPFVIVNGDTLTDIDMEGLAESHRRSSALVTLALAPNLDPERYGGVTLDSRGAVTGFVRRGIEARGSFHFVGVQVASADAFRDLPPGRPADSVGGVYDALIARRPGSVRGVVADAAPFWDIGTVADYWRTSLALAQGQAVSAWRGRNVVISPAAEVRRSILWDDVEVSDGCEIEDCIITDGVRLPPGSRHRRTVLRIAAHGIDATPIEIESTVFTAGPLRDPDRPAPD